MTIEKQRIIPTRRIIRGVDPWLRVRNEVFCYWDLWFIILLVDEHHDDWNDFRRRIKDHNKERRFGKTRDIEAILSHFDELKERIKKLGYIPSELIGDISNDRKKILKKAKTKIFEGILDRDKTQAMRNTPRKRLYAHALRGNWNLFHISPQDYQLSFERLLKKRDFWSASASMGLEDRLRAALETESKKSEANSGKRWALYRAYLTIILERQDNIDDSFGAIGDAFQDAFSTYLSTNWKRTEVSPDTFLLDLLEFIVWEDYGLVKNKVILKYFEKLKSPLVELCVKILEKLREELSEYELEYQADKALTYLGMLRIAQKQYNEFPGLAKEMGSRKWERITMLAEAAKKAKRFDVMTAVFETADQPGFHQQYLQERFLEMKKERKLD